VNGALGASQGLWKRSRNAAAQDLGEEDDNDQHEDATEPAEQQPPTETATNVDQDESESVGGGAAADAFSVGQ
jgi:hypothetical protein